MLPDVQPALAKAAMDVRQREAEVRRVRRETWQQEKYPHPVVRGEAQFDPMAATIDRSHSSKPRAIWFSYKTLSDQPQCRRQILCRLRLLQSASDHESAGASAGIVA